MTYEYFLAFDDGNIVIRRNQDATLERFDLKKEKWINDPEIRRIYFGDMPVRNIKEEDVSNYIGSAIKND